MTRRTRIQRTVWLGSILAITLNGACVAQRGALHARIEEQDAGFTCSVRHGGTELRSERTQPPFPVWDAARQWCDRHARRLTGMEVPV